jgi:hypothetical protein
MTPREAALSLALSPEFIEGPVLSLSKDRRVASLYQDKEVRKKSKINEENTFKDSVLEISGFYRNESGNPVASYGEFAI